MDETRAKEILTVLANGIDPLSGEVLPENHVCNKGDVLRALQVAIKVLSKQKKDRNLPENFGKPWKPVDDQNLSKMYDNQTRIEDMCTYFKRTRGSIIARLVHIGKVSSIDEFNEGNFLPRYNIFNP